MKSGECERFLTRISLRMSLFVIWSEFGEFLVHRLSWCCLAILKTSIRSLEIEWKNFWTQVSSVSKKSLKAILNVNSLWSQTTNRWTWVTMSFWTKTGLRPAQKMNYFTCFVKDVTFIERTPPFSWSRIISLSGMELTVLFAWLVRGSPNMRFYWPMHLVRVHGDSFIHNW